jgi:hypothetical protein
MPVMCTAPLPDRAGSLHGRMANAQLSMISVPADVPLGASCDCLCGATQALRDRLFHGFDRALIPRVEWL